MRTAKCLFAFLAILGLGPAPAVADSLELAEREGSLLHRRLVLSGVQRWDRQNKTLVPLPIPSRSPVRLYVVNVWSVHCKPCLAEFPLLQRMAKAWQADPRVAFLFIADPPAENSESELADFWTRFAPSLPAADPWLSQTPAFQKSIDLDIRPITLLVDDQLIVRQSFVGSVSPRNLGSAIERLLKVVTSTH